MKNTTSKGAWAIKNTTIPLDNPTADENAPEILEITRAAERLGAEVDGYDIDNDDLIDGVSVTGPAEAIEALVGLFTADAPAGDIFDRLVANWRASANEDLDTALRTNGEEEQRDPTNLYRAGVFAGLAEAAAWLVYATVTPEDDADDINAITAAVYRAYNVAW